MVHQLPHLLPLGKQGRTGVFLRHMGVCAAALREAIVFDSELSMLLRMVQTPTGAQLLLENGILQRLTECRWIDQRPDYATLQGI